jgi:hypothetical protein
MIPVATDIAFKCLLLENIGESKGRWYASLWNQNVC